MPVQNRLNQRGYIPRIILQVGVLNDDYLSDNVPDGGPQGCAFASIAFVAKDANRLAAEFSNQVRRSVGRAIVDDNDLITQTNERVLQPVDQCRDSRRFIERRHYDRY